MATIYDVAKKAGVSIATVSYVISKRKRVKKTTEAKVLEAIKELGYVPNIIAQSLNTRKTKTIGFIIPAIISPAFSEIVEYAEKAANEKGYFLYLCNSENKSEIEKSYIIDLEKKWVDGILITTDDIKTIKILKNINIPFVIVNREFKEEKNNVVIANNEEMSYKAVSFLIKTGCRRVAIINGPKEIQSAVKRFNGYRKAMEENNLFKEELVFFGDSRDFTPDIGVDITNKILREKIEIDSIFCGNDLIAFGTFNTLLANNIKVPEDVSIISADESFLTKSIEPKFSKIVFPYEALSKQAVELLLNKIHGKKSKKNKKEKIIISGKLLLGNTKRRL